MKQIHLWTLFAGGLALQALVYFLWQSYAPQKPTPQAMVESSANGAKGDVDIHDVAKGFVENQTSLALGGLGGVTATLFAVIEKFRLSTWRKRWITLSISLFSGSLFFGYVATGTILRELSEVGRILVDTGDFHVATSMQFLSLIFGAIAYAALVLDLINDPQRRETTN